MNRNYVLCRIKHKGDEKADNSTMELVYEASGLENLDSILRQPDHEDLFTEVRRKICLVRVLNICLNEHGKCVND